MSDIVYSMTGDTAGLERAWQKANGLIDSHRKSLLSIKDSWTNVTTESDKYAKLAERGMTQAFQAGRSALERYRADLRAAKSELTTQKFDLQPGETELDQLRRIAAARRAMRDEAKARYRADLALIKADATDHLAGADKARRAAAELEILNDGRKKALQLVLATEPALARMNRRLAEAAALHRAHPDVMNSKQFADAQAKIRADAAEPSALAGIGRMAAGWLTIGTAIRVARMELETLKERQTGALAANVLMGPLAQEAIFNLGNIDPDNPVTAADLNKKLTEIASRTGVPKNILTAASGRALSSKGPLKIEEAMNALEKAAEFAPLSTAEQLASIAYSVGNLMNNLSLQKPEQALGYLTSVGKTSNVASTDDLVQYVLPNIASMVMAGYSARGAQAMLSAEGAMRGDKVGRISSTAGVQLVKFLRDRYPEIAPEEAEAKIRSSEYEFNKFFEGGMYRSAKHVDRLTGRVSYRPQKMEGVTFDAKADQPMREYLSPKDTPLQRAYREAYRVAVAPEQSEPLYHEKIASQKTNSAFRMSRISQQVDADDELRKLEDTESARAGVMHKVIEKMNSAGMGWTQRQIASAQFWARMNVFQETANDAARKVLDAQIVEVEQFSAQTEANARLAKALRDAKKYFEKTPEEEFKDSGRITSPSAMKDNEGVTVIRSAAEKLAAELRIAAEEIAKAPKWVQDAWARGEEPAGWKNPKTKAARDKANAAEDDKFWDIEWQASKPVDGAAVEADGPTDEERAAKRKEFNEKNAAILKRAEGRLRGRGGVVFGFTTGRVVGDTKKKPVGDSPLGGDPLWDIEWQASKPTKKNTAEAHARWQKRLGIGTDENPVEGPARPKLEMEAGEFTPPVGRNQTLEQIASTLKDIAGSNEAMRRWNESGKSNLPPIVINRAPSRVAVDEQPSSGRTPSLRLSN